MISVLRLRMLAWALALPVLKHLVPLPRLARLAWADRPSRGELSSEVVVNAVARTRLLSSRGNCLERSVVLYRYLSWVGAEPRLVAGLRREGTRLCGHAWVTVAGEPAGELPELVATYTPIVAFGPRGEPDSFEALARDDEQDPLAAAALKAARESAA